jgi:histidinol phosphatase-like enzyme
LKKIQIIAIDFDGVIVPENFPFITELMPGAKETIKDLYEAGYQLILWTARTDAYIYPPTGESEFLQKAKDFLEENNMLHYFKTVNTNIDPNADCRKVYCHMFIDDRNLGGFPGWGFVRKELLND